MRKERHTPRGNEEEKKLRKRLGELKRERVEQMLYFSGVSFPPVAWSHGGMTSLHQSSLMTLAAPLNALVRDFFITTS